MACSGSPRPGSRSSYDASAIPPSRGPVRNHPLAPDGPPLRADTHAGVGTSVDEPRAPAGGQPGGGRDPHRAGGRRPTAPAPGRTPDGDHPPAAPGEGGAPPAPRGTVSLGERGAFAGRAP